MIKKEKIKILFLMIMLFCANQLSAQKKIFSGNPDTAFKVARDLAFNGKRAQAQDSLRFILTKHPNYLDVRSLLASTYSWDGKYAKAKKEFEYILNKDKERKNDWIAYIKNEQYSEKYFSSLKIIENALKLFPDDADLMQLKARSEFNRNNKEEAYRIIESAVEIHPNNAELLEYKKSLEAELRFNTISVSLSTDFYDANKDNGRANMYYSSLSYSRQTKYGSVIARFNYANRFETDNYQFEVDMYPRIINGLYAYVNAGYSSSPLNPAQRYGFELYKSLPKSLEASLGFRWLKFSTETTIYTGSLGWYTGNSYLGLRGYVTPGDPGTSTSGRIIYRKFRKDADNYFNLEIGFGASPALDRFAPGFTGDEIFNLDSQALVLGYFFSTKNKKNLLGFTASMFREEKPFAKGEFFVYPSFGASYSIRFK
ncbi:YaiO family outer membrane beta-barrel protein [Polaribacter sp. Asnod6-C07]|uniref:YaiO family outer membrane beta-barrel protein n=1 Tax=Polaribacter sp. Asnod6-C07 TaxID=3160582 RepID=UPI00386560F0